MRKTKYTDQADNLVSNFLGKKTWSKTNPLDSFVTKKSKKEDKTPVEKKLKLTDKTSEEIEIDTIISLSSAVKMFNPVTCDFETLSKARIQREFFMTDGVDLARKLIGRIIIRKIDDVYVRCRIVETEAYIGPHDKGAHCYNNKKTDRTKYFWNKGGCLYVYMIHNSNCLNIVANDADKPEAILIRAVEPLNGIEKIKELRGDKNPSIATKKIVNLSNGPGKVGAALKIDRSHNAVDMCTSDEIFLVDDVDSKFTIERSVRININYAEEYIYKPWRFFIKDNPFVSKVKIEHQYIEE